MFFDAQGARGNCPPRSLSVLCGYHTGDTGSRAISLLFVALIAWTGDGDLEHDLGGATGWGLAPARLRNRSHSTGGVGIAMAVVASTS